ncbi:hypothetical protein D9M68_912660 [compost metagenome]
MIHFLPQDCFCFCGIGILSVTCLLFEIGLQQLLENIWVCAFCIIVSEMVHSLCLECAKIGTIPLIFYRLLIIKENVQSVLLPDPRLVLAHRLCCLQGLRHVSFRNALRPTRY